MAAYNILNTNDYTDFQEVIINFQSKVPTFEGTLQLLVQYLKSAISRCHRQVYDNLEFWYDEEILEGHFCERLQLDTIELLAMYMAQEHFLNLMSLYDKRKQYLGTQAFNKIPNLKDNYDFITTKYNFWSEEIRKLRDELPDYSEER